jgi:sarcosine oxidase
VLIDQHGPANNRASSGGESRIIRMGYGTKEIYTRWSLRALELYKDFYARTDAGLYHQTGFLWLAAENDEFTMANIGVFDKLKVAYEKLTLADLRKRYPQIGLDGIAWGLYEPNAGGLMARRGVQTVVRETVKAGLRYEQRRITAVPPQEVSAGTYIYACGPWLRTIFPELLGNKINPTRQEVFYFGTAPGDASFRAPAMPAWVDPGSTAYGLPDLEARGFKVAPDNHGPTIDPDMQERVVPGASVDRVRAYLRKRFPALGLAPCTQTEVCQYENTANGDYVIDRHPSLKDVWIVGGGSGHGYKHGPALGEYVAAALLKGAAVDPRFSLAAKPVIEVGGRSSTIPSSR